MNHVLKLQSSGSCATQHPQLVLSTKTVYACGSSFCDPSNSVAPLHGSGGRSEGTPMKHREPCQARNECSIRTELVNSHEHSNRQTLCTSASSPPLPLVRKSH